jgi:hypothetical protein
MGREHLLTDNPEAIAFGRARLAALRAAGQRYVTQVFDTPFGRVKVRIVGGVEYIYAESGGYQTLQATSAHPDGEGTGIDVFSSFILKGDLSLKVSQRRGHKVGVNTWRNAGDRTVVAYNTGQDAQHKHFYSVDEMNVDGVPRLVVRGMERATDFGVKGAATCFGQVVYAAYEWDSSHIVCEALVIYSSGEPDVEIGRFPLAAAGLSPRDVVVFGGSGTKFVTSLTSGSSVVMLTGTITDDAGRLSVDFDLATDIPHVPPPNGLGREIWLALGKENELLVGVLTNLSSRIGRPVVFAGLDADSTLSVNGQALYTWPQEAMKEKTVFMGHINLRDGIIAWADVVFEARGEDRLVNMVSHVSARGFPRVEKEVISDGLLTDYAGYLDNLAWYAALRRMHSTYAGQLDNMAIGVRWEKELAVSYAPIPPIFFGGFRPDDAYHPDNWFDDGYVDLYPLTYFGRGGQLNTGPGFSEFSKHTEEGFHLRSVSIH